MLFLCSKEVTSMQRLLLSALLVALGIYQVEGFPGGGETSGTTSIQNPYDNSMTISAYLDLTQGEFRGVSDAFTKLLLSQAHGTIPFDATNKFLKEAEGILPKSAKLLKVACYTISTITTLISGQVRKISVYNVFKSALQHYLGELGANTIKEEWPDLCPTIYRVTLREEEAAQDIVAFLHEHYDDFQRLEGQSLQEQLNLLRLFAADTDHFRD